MRPVILAVSMLLLSGPSWGEVYKWTDADGKIHFSDQRPVAANSEEVTLRINTYTHVTFDAAAEDVGQNVVMYSTDWCGYCKKARSYFRQHNIPFTDYDIEKDAAAQKRYKKLGATGVPVILVGDKRMNGFSEKGFARIYQ